jgi:hypothetical protein
MVMKSKNKVLIVLFAVIIAFAAYTQKASAQQPYVSFQVFYDELSPFGEWVNYPNWGYVWIPDAGSDFVPYSTDGHWILSDYGWTWVSYYSWGWAPFHYGRWDFDHYYGWFWIPGNEWGPAWVSWRRAEGYYGWAPMEPGISLSVSFGRGYDSHNDHWIFVRDRDIDRSDINNYYINSVDQDIIVRRSSVINNTYTDNRRHTTYVAGPDRADVQKAAGRQVKPVAIQEYSKPGQEISNGNFRIYRPEVKNNNNEAARPAPARVVNLKDVRQPSERNSINRNKDLNNANSSQPSTNTPSQNIRRDQRSNNVKSQYSSPSQNVQREAQPDNIKPQNPNPPQNFRRESQQNNVKPQNANPPQNIRRETQPNYNKSQNVNPVQNVTREAPPNNVKSQGLPPVQNVRTEQQQNNNKDQKIIPQQNNGRRQESTTDKSSGNNNRGKQNKSDDSKDKKEHKENKEN